MNSSPPPIVESLRVTGVQAQRLVKFRDRLLEAPGSPQGKATIVVCLAGLGIFCRRPLQDGHRLLHLALPAASLDPSHNVQAFSYRGVRNRISDIRAFGKSKMAQATRLYEDAAKCVAADAAERLDIELARSELKE